jgi:hypothetical protein
MRLKPQPAQESSTFLSEGNEWSEEVKENQKENVWKDRANENSTENPGTGCGCTAAAGTVWKHTIEGYGQKREKSKSRMEEYL